MFTGGSVAAALVALNAFTAIPDPPRAELAAESTCQITSPTEPLGAVGGGHPPRAFFEPGQPTPVADFGHSLGDGYVVVLYSRDIAAADLAALREFVTSPDGEGVLAGAADDTQAALTVLQQRDTMTCEQVEVDSVRAFSENWLGPRLG